MKNCLLIMACLFFAACSVGVDSDGIPTALSATKGALTYAPSAPERFKTANGITVLFIEDAELPLLDIRFFNRKGSLHLAAVPQAVKVAMASQMRAGGAGQWEADELDRELETLSASASSNIDSEYATVSISGLASDRRRLFEILSAIVRTPRFDEKRLAIWQGAALDSISRRIEDPYTIASTSFNALLFPDSVYGKVTTSKEVSEVSRLNMLRAHRQLFSPQEAIVTVTGSIERNELKALVEEYFAQWQVQAGAYNSIPPVTHSAKPGIYLIEMPFEQATFIVGQQGVPRLSPQHYAISVFNEIFGGGGFSTRLVERVRVQLGLAYSVYGAVSPDVVKGKNFITAQTKGESVVPAINASLQVLEGLQKEGVTSSEISETQNSIENSLVFRFDSPEALAARFAALDLLQYPTDYDATYLSNIRSVSALDVQSVAQELWDKDSMVAVIVANKEACAAVEQAVASGEFALSELPVRRASFKETVTLK